MSNRITNLTAKDLTLEHLYLQVSARQEPRSFNEPERLYAGQLLGFEIAPSGVTLIFSPSASPRTVIVRGDTPVQVLDLDDPEEDDSISTAQDASSPSGRIFSHFGTN